MFKASQQLLREHFQVQEIDLANGNDNENENYDNWATAANDNTYSYGFDSGYEADNELTIKERTHNVSGSPGDTITIGI